MSHLPTDTFLMPRYGPMIYADDFATTTQINGGLFTWTKPSDVTNAKARRDFTFTYYAYVNTGGDYTANSNDIIGTLQLHITYAEVDVQFAGMGDFVERTSAGGQTTDNTVVVGQKVDAIVKPDQRLTVTSYAWSVPTDV